MISPRPIFLHSPYLIPLPKALLILLWKTAGLYACSPGEKSVGAFPSQGPMKQASETLGPQESDSCVAALCPLRRVLASSGSEELIFLFFFDSVSYPTPSLILVPVNQTQFLLLPIKELPMAAER